MKKCKFSDEQLALALKQAELAISVEEVCRNMGISEARFYVWKNEYAGVGSVGAASAAAARGREPQAQADRG